MKISDRFTDYGPIGGFFWLLQLAIWCVAEAMTPMDLIRFIDTNFKMLPTSVTSLLGVLGLILVFVTGLVMDLFGSQLLKNIERRIFLDLAGQHAAWFRSFVERSRTFIGTDFDAKSLELAGGAVISCKAVETGKLETRKYDINRC